ncbi:MAG: saccharopine dehydrogenase family protein [Candidatus Bathyarchaeia archaeon]
MKVLVIGIGRMGYAVLRDLMESDDVTEIVAADLHFERLKRWVDRLRETDERAEKMEPIRIDATDRDQLRDVLKRGFDVVSDCLLWTYTPLVTKACVDAGTSHVDLSSDLSPPELNELDKSAKDAGATIIPDCGMDPGIDHVVEGYAARKLDKVKKIHLYIADGIPQKGTPAYYTPLQYTAIWTVTGIISELSGKTKILLDGKEVEVDKLAEPETLIFPKPIGEVEAWYSKYPKTLIESLGLKDVEEAWDKTVRWPSWCETWRKLIALNLTDTEPMTIKGANTTPLEFFTQLLEKYLKPDPEAGDRDLVAEKIEVIGEKDGAKTKYSYLMIDFYDENKGLTAFQRATGYPISIVSQMIGRGDIKKKGVIHCGKLGWNTELAKKFFSELAKRNLIINESVTTPLS